MAPEPSGHRPGELPRARDGASEVAIDYPILDHRRIERDVERTRAGRVRRRDGDVDTAPDESARERPNGQIRSAVDRGGRRNHVQNPHPNAASASARTAEPSPSIAWAVAHRASAYSAHGRDQVIPE